MSIHTTVLAGATPVLTAAVTADDDATVVANDGLRLCGYSLVESNSSAAVFSGKIVNGATGAAAGEVVHFEGIALSSETVWFGDAGIACPLGISIDWLTGEFDITVYYKIVI